VNVSDDSEVVLVERRGAVAVMYLNRPDVMNAVNEELAAAHPRVLRELDADPSVRAIVITGSGRGFCAGADLGVLSNPDRKIGALVPPLEDMPNIVKRFKTPVIAAVNGAVAGIGYAIMMGSDVRFIAKEAKIATSFARLGLAAEYGLSWTLPRQVGTGRALDLLLSGRAITGDEAVTYGLCEFAVPLEELLDAAIAYAEDLATNCSPTLIAVIKHQVASDLERGEDEGMRETLKLMFDAFEGADLAEAVAARKQKRQVAFPPLA
jgi:enoyl-CoA hydratase/carnithine racemase